MQIIEETPSRAKAGAGVSFNNLSVTPLVAADKVNGEFKSADSGREIT